MVTQQGCGLLVIRYSPCYFAAAMKQSIRNQLPGAVKSIVADKVLSEVLVETNIGEIAAVITTRSVEEMKLKAGDKVFALVKATNVSIGARV
jgi:molybdate transport system regulatory protein